MGQVYQGSDTNNELLRRMCLRMGDGGRADAMGGNRSLLVHLMSGVRLHFQRLHHFGTNAHPIPQSSEAAHGKRNVFPVVPRDDSGDEAMDGVPVHRVTR